MARELALRARSRLLAERALEVGLHEPTPGPVDGRSRDLHGGRDHLVGDALVRRQEDLRALDLAGRVTPAAQQSLKLLTFRLAKVDMELYNHLYLLLWGGLDESEMSQSLGEQQAPYEPRFTQLQGQYLAFIHAYDRIFKRAPAEADMRRHFGVTAPSVHQMVLTLEKAGLISREPGAPRSIKLLIPPEALPILR
jgi:DNA-binding MarR family transcriptional regulator